MCQTKVTFKALNRKVDYLATITRSNFPETLRSRAVDKKAIRRKFSVKISRLPETPVASDPRLPVMSETTSTEGKPNFRLYARSHRSFQRVGGWMDRKEQGSADEGVTGGTFPLALSPSRRRAISRGTVIIDAPSAKKGTF